MCLLPIALRYYTTRLTILLQLRMNLNSELALKAPEVCNVGKTILMVLEALAQGTLLRQEACTCSSSVFQLWQRVERGSGQGTGVYIPPSPWQAQKHCPKLGHLHHTLPS